MKLLLISIIFTILAAVGNMNNSIFCIALFFFCAGIVSIIKNRKVCQ